MKKAISIMLVLVMCLSLCSCAGETKSNEIKLTLDNYDDYLDFSAYVYGTQEKETAKDYWLGAYYNSGKLVENDFYTGYSGSLSAKVVAPNYNFHNVTVKIRFTGKVLTIIENSNPDSPTTLNHDIDFEDTFELNVGGTVKDGKHKIIDLPQNMLILDYGISDSHYKYKYDIIESWEIVEISGTVSPA